MSSASQKKPDSAAPDVTDRIPPRILALFERIGYHFQDAELIERALTHASYGDGRRKNVDNERLEFLGDRVLGLLTAKTLFDKTKSKEGVMATRLNALVRKETCARVAQNIRLGEALLMSSSEEKQGGREKVSILGNACEALMAALYIDGGYKQAEEFYDRFWQGEIDTVLEESTKDPKTNLQELALSIGPNVPHYTQVDRSGPDHRPTFTIRVTVEELGEALGEGQSKKEAEREAASHLLKALEKTI